MKFVLRKILVVCASFSFLLANPGCSTGGTSKNQGEESEKKPDKPKNTNRDDKKNEGNKNKGGKKDETNSSEGEEDNLSSKPPASFGSEESDEKNWPGFPNGGMRPPSRFELKLLTEEPEFPWTKQDHKSRKQLSFTKIPGVRSIETDDPEVLKILQEFLKTSKVAIDTEKNRLTITGLSLIQIFDEMGYALTDEEQDFYLGYYGEGNPLLLSVEDSQLPEITGNATTATNGSAGFNSNHLKVPETLTDSQLVFKHNGKSYTTRFFSRSGGRAHIELSDSDEDSTFVTLHSEYIPERLCGRDFHLNSNTGSDTHDESKPKTYKTLKFAMDDIVSQMKDKKIPESTLVCLHLSAPGEDSEELLEIRLDEHIEIPTSYFEFRASNPIQIVGKATCSSFRDGDKSWGGDNLYIDKTRCYCSAPDLEALNLLTDFQIPKLGTQTEYKIDEKVRLICKDSKKIPNKLVKLTCKGSWSIPRHVECLSLEEHIEKHLKSPIDENSKYVEDFDFLNKLVNLDVLLGLNEYRQLGKQQCKADSHFVHYSKEFGCVLGDSHKNCLETGQVLVYDTELKQNKCVCNNFIRDFTKEKYYEKNMDKGARLFNFANQCVSQNDLKSRCAEKGGTYKDDGKNTAFCIKGHDECKEFDKLARVGKFENMRRVWFLNESKNESCQYRSDFEKNCKNAAESVDSPSTCELKENGKKNWDDICSSPYWLDGKMKGLCINTCPPGSTKQRNGKCKFDSDIILLSGYRYDSDGVDYIRSRSTAKRVIDENHAAYANEHNYAHLAFTDYTDGTCKNDFYLSNSMEFHRNIFSKDKETNCLPYWSKIYYIKYLLSEVLDLEQKSTKQFEQASQTYQPKYLVWLDDDMILLNDKYKSSDDTTKKINLEDVQDQFYPKDIIVMHDKNSAEINTGFLMVAIGKNTKDIFEKWYELRNGVGYKYETIGLQTTNSRYYNLGLCRQQTCFHEQEAYLSLKKEYNASTQISAYFSVRNPSDPKDNGFPAINRFARVSHFNPDKDIHQKVLLYGGEDGESGDPDFIKCDVAKDFMCQCTGLARKGYKLKNDILQQVIRFAKSFISSDKSDTDNADMSISYNFRDLCIQHLLKQAAIEDISKRTPFTLDTIHETDGVKEAE